MQHKVPLPTSLLCSHLYCPYWLTLALTSIRPLRLILLFDEEMLALFLQHEILQIPQCAICDLVERFFSEEPLMPAYEHIWKGH